MIKRMLFVCAFGAMFSVHTINAQEQVKYREFELGSSVASVVKLTGAVPADVKLVHQRPAMLQDLEWRPRYSLRGSSALADPVDRVLFSFYNDGLYRVLVDYDTGRTAGLSQGDIVAAISASYGPALLPAPRTAAVSSQYGEPNILMATWGTAEAKVQLFRAAEPVKYRLIIESTATATLARTAVLEAGRLDVREAPQRELARQQKEIADEQAAKEAAKRVNLPAFRP